MDDMALVREYADRKSEAAFETLVARHVNFVYSTALRLVRNPHLAEEVTQATFIILERKATALGPGTILPVWLLKTARFVAMTESRSTLRRQRRETEAHMEAMIQQQSPDEANWEQIAPVLDKGLAQLNEKDRAAVVLRFFKQQSLEEVGTALGVDTGTAQRRVHRAVEKLRRFFTKRGVVISATALTGAIAANAVQAAPAGLAASVAAAAVKGTVVTASTLTLVKGALKIMAWTKLKMGIISAVIVAGVVTTSVVLQQRTASSTIANATKDHPFINSLGMKFVPVPGTEVLFSVWDTRVQDFEAFVKETGYNATEGMFSLRSDGLKQRGDSWRSPGFAQTPEHPVCGVSWNDANEFCKWLSKKEGKTYRLPTDAEWSHAVGIGGKEIGATPQKKTKKLPDIYPWGNSMPPMVNGKPMGNYAGAEADDSNWLSAAKVIPEYRDNFARTSPVGSFPANALGLYDMGGNVWQWCEDRYEPGKEPRVLRGGSWINNGPRDLLSSSRNGFTPVNRLDNIGFRVVLVDKPLAESRPTIATATKDHPYINSLGMKFVPVPGTEVLFSVWDTRVKDFEAFVKETGYDATKGMASMGNDGWKQRGDSWQSPGFPQTPDHPVCGVSWNDANEFCKWISKKEGKFYRLPTDAEWSYAVGIGDREIGATPMEKFGKLPGVYPWGNSMPPTVNGKPSANFAEVMKNGVLVRDGFKRTSPVGSFPANALGLYDMAGNVWQWCEDQWLSQETRRVLRGGSWSESWQLILSSWRADRRPEDRYDNTGFRVVLATKPATEPRLVATIASTTKDHPYTNSLGMQFVPVPGTEVLFSVWDTRVKDFEAFVKETGYDATAGMSTLRSDGWKQRGDSWLSPGFPQTPDHPVIGVSWNDANTFCQWLSKKEGKKYRLPTDAEWSYAVGIGAQETGATPTAKNGKLRNIYPWGTAMPPMVNGKPTGNYAGAEAEDGNWPATLKVIPGHRDNFARTSPVGSFPANELGLYDMGGNVWQWCEDKIEPGSNRRVWRGGSWFSSSPGPLLSSFRDGRPPEERALNGGFRVVLATKSP